LGTLCQNTTSRTQSAMKLFNLKSLEMKADPLISVENEESRSSLTKLIQ